MVGETGSGKTTQVPVYLLDAGFGQRGRIGITQPRRLAATSVAEYVADRMGCRVGEEVGYQIRFDDTTTEGTRISFMTDGILLQEAKSDPLFSRYEVLVFDEAHERNLNTDFGLGLVKHALNTRDDLKVVIMSATIDADKFSAFFGGAPIINVEGKTYPVEVRYLDAVDEQDAQDLFMDRSIEALAAFKVGQIHRSGKPGDILVFMPGKDEIYKTIRLIEQLHHQDLHTLAVYGDMTPQEQRRIFDRFSGRKVIVATNIAETSITIDGVVHVVDSGLIKQMNFDPNTGIRSLSVTEHSKSGLAQRLGRAGRTQPGVCWRLFLSEEYETGRLPYQGWSKKQRDQFTKPEILRTDLAGVVLRMIGIGITDVESFEFVDMPVAGAIHNAYEALKALEALNEDNQITTLGHRLLDLPVEPRIGRMILAAEDYGCADEIVTIAASLSVRDVFRRPRDKELEADAAKARFTDPRSDFLTTLNVVEQYLANQGIREWTQDNFLNYRALEQLLNIRGQLLEILERLRVEVASVGYRKPKDRFDPSPEEKAQAEAIGKAVTAGLIQNLSILRRGVDYVRNGDLVRIHPGSGLFSELPRLLTCDSIVKTKTRKSGMMNFARSCQEVELPWVEEIAPHLLKTEVETTPSWSYSPEEGYVYQRRTYLAGVEISSESTPAKGPEVVRKFAEDLANEQRFLSFINHNQQVMYRLETIYRASGGITKLLTREELTEFYVERLGDATTKAESEEKNLQLNLDDYVSAEERKQYGSERPSLVSQARARISDLATTLRKESPKELDEFTKNKIEDLRKRLDAMSLDPKEWGFQSGWNGSSQIRSLLGDLRSAEDNLRWDQETEAARAKIDSVRSSVERHEELHQRRLERQARKAEEERQAEEERRQLQQEEEGYKEYETALVALKAKAGSWPGFGTYQFPFNANGDPEDYLQDGFTHTLDWDHTEVLPDENESYWGFVTQTIPQNGGGTIRKIALLLEVRSKPAHLSD
ncbi:ATP-dependent RNA helicase [Patescibacteria group bacterium]|nr:ATP-dependent RNA helicase [Patescibacteria group bacterium]